MWKHKWKLPTIWSWWWRDWSSYWDSNASFWADAEAKREFKTKVKEAAAKEFIPIDVNVSNIDKLTNFWKNKRVRLQIKPEDVKHLNSDERIERLIKFCDKLPYNSDFIDWLIMKRFVNPNLDLAEYRKSLLDESKELMVDTLIKDFVDWVVTHDAVRKYFRQPTLDETKANPFWKSEGWYKGWGKVWTYEAIDDIGRYNKILRIIQSRIRPRAHTMFEESLRKWKRINRNFINWSSYKPLMSKEVLQPRKKKLMIVYDCSGSMGYINSWWGAAYNAAPFIAAMTNSWVFDIEHVVYHSNSGWEDVARKIKKWEVFHYGWGSEWFEYIDDNLPDSWSRWVDYIIAITDLQIGTGAQQGLYDYLSKCNKHMVLSFLFPWSLNWMNVRCVKDVKWMLNAVSSLVGTD